MDDAQAGRLIVEWDAKIDRFVEKANQVLAHSKKTARGVEEDWKRIDLEHAMSRVMDRGRLSIIDAGAEHLGLMGGALEHLGVVGLATGAVIGSLGGMIEEGIKSAEWAESLEKAAKTIGITTDAVQEFDFAALKAGISQDTMRESLGKLYEKIGQVQSGTARGMTTKAFEALLGKDPAEQLRQLGDLEHILPVIAEKLASLPAGERAGLAAKIDLAPVLPALLKGKEGLAETTKEAHELGLVLDKDLVKKGAEAAERMKVAGDVLDKGMKTGFIALTPAIAAATEALGHFIETWFSRPMLLTDMVSPDARKLMAKGEQFAPEARRMEEEARARLNIGGSAPTTAMLLARLGMRDPAPKQLVAGAHTGPTAEERAKTGDDAVAKATEAELRAKEALTANVEERLTIALQLLKAETDQKKTDLEHQVTEKKISRAKASQAETLIAAAAKEQAELLRRDAAYKIEDQEIAIHNFKVDQLLAQLADEAGMTTTAGERRKIEAQILAIRQQQARDLEAQADARAVKDGSMTPGEAAARQGALAATQSADSKKAIYDNYYQGIHGALDAAVKGGWPGLAKYMADKLKTSLVDALANGLTNILIGGGSGGGGAGGLFGSFIGAMLGIPHHASGTDSSSGGPAIVGENGPEVLNLPRGSRVTPNHALSNLQIGRGASQSIFAPTFNFDGAVMTQDLVDQMNAIGQRAAANGAAMGLAAARALVPAEMSRRAGLQIR